jgi:putative Holliday junction resolvase
MRVLGLDVGERRIGVAVSDENLMLARPLLVIQRRSRQDDFARLAAIIGEWHVGRVVVGLPLTIEGEIGPQARRVKRYARELGRALNVPVELVDESYSTVDAANIMRTVGHSPQKRRDTVDAVAAAVILQSYLDRGSPSAVSYEVLNGKN